MMGDARQFARNSFRRENEIDTPRRDRGARHAVVLGGLILRQGDAARAFDSFDTEGAIRAGAGENDADRAFADILRERA